MDYLKYDTGTGEEKNWLVEEAVFSAAYLGKCESIFCQGNGYLCQRSALEERYVGETRGLFVTGTFDLFSPQEVTELPNLPDMTRIKLLLNGERFSMETGTLRNFRRVLNLKNGLVARSVEWESPKGHRYALSFERFVAMDNEHLLGGRMRVTPLNIMVKKDDNRVGIGAKGMSGEGYKGHSFWKPHGSGSAAVPMTRRRIGIKLATSSIRTSIKSMWTTMPIPIIWRPIT